MTLLFNDVQKGLKQMRWQQQGKDTGIPDLKNIYEYKGIEHETTQHSGKYNSLGMDGVKNTFKNMGISKKKQIGENL